MSNLTYQQVKALLRQKGFSNSAIEQIRLAMIDDAIKNATEIKADRLYTIVAVMLHRAYGFGYKRMFKGLTMFDELNGQMESGEITWEGLMKDLHEETGVLVRTGNGDRIGFEYDPSGE